MLQHREQAEIDSRRIVEENRVNRLTGSWAVLGLARYTRIARLIITSRLHLNSARHWHKPNAMPRTSAAHSVDLFFVVILAPERITSPLPLVITLSRTERAS
ncbi:hypothetical protein [Xenorhabdus szentirmaii]|uniref:hypothetical protein n=1 Tax=Xenorhabdus szentirmaii TaxID=290112 RepID=UPI002B40D038|nr:hypothetical protein [Xenorhabdus sp. 38]